eukprot:TRINITY_DN21209_c0_g1_i1.p2 TRINITY_DN21209_c0_g1~~TRINITY_DN21209_c0_g1_i1.p2  ORF type:complete len:169 (+),score=12.63 TRINITY_DN21209_c0_g1_i1:61-507(+)
MAAQGTKRAYDAGDVSVLENPKVAIVSAAKRRYTKWERMQTLMLRAVSGLADGEAAARSATSLGLNEHCRSGGEPRRGASLLCAGQDAASHQRGHHRLLGREAAGGRLRARAGGRAERRDQGSGEGTAAGPAVLRLDADGGAAGREVH